MRRLIIKIVLAYMIGAMLGACAAMLALEYNYSFFAAITVAMIVTIIIDFTILRDTF